MGLLGLASKQFLRCVVCLYIEPVSQPLNSLQNPLINHPVVSVLFITLCILLAFVIGTLLFDC